MSGRPADPNGKIGMVYGNLTLEKYIGTDGSNRKIYLCRCACGRESKRMLTDMQKGKAKDCGCGNVRNRGRKRGDLAPPREDCVSFMPEKINCVALDEMIFASEGDCPFYKRR